MSWAIFTSSKCQASGLLQLNGEFFKKKEKISPHSLVRTFTGYTQNKLFLCYFLNTSDRKQAIFLSQHRDYINRIIYTISSESMQ